MDDKALQRRHASNLTRESHYVPRGLLKRWAADGANVYAYRTLVSHSRVPLWTLQPVRGSAVRKDLYTGLSDGSETDETERWFATEFERPGIEASERLILGKHVNRDDWYAMIRLVALQHLRTPQSYFESITGLERDLPQILERSAHESIERLERAKREGQSVQIESTTNAFSGLLDVQILKSATSGNSVVQSTVRLDRRFWIAKIRHVLNGVADKLLHHEWAVWEPATGMEWPITDDPSIRLNWYSDNFDFGGGWGRRGSELMMPLSPRHLVYTRVGMRSRRRFAAPPELTRRVQKVLAQRAYRWIFSTMPFTWVSAERPRVVDHHRFQQEEDRWNQWHEDQLRSELGSD